MRSGCGVPGASEFESQLLRIAIFCPYCITQLREPMIIRFAAYACGKMGEMPRVGKSLRRISSDASRSRCLSLSLLPPSLVDLPPPPPEPETAPFAPPFAQKVVKHNAQSSSMLLESSRAREAPRKIPGGEAVPLLLPSPSYCGAQTKPARPLFVSSSTPFQAPKTIKLRSTHRDGSNVPGVDRKGLLEFTG